MGAIKEAWAASENKSQETLTEILKSNKYGMGKWMVFSHWSEVDRLWRKVVSALWEGKLGSSAKVSGADQDDSDTHVICVYCDPFWDEKEVERVLVILRTVCGMPDAMKFKVDGVTHLDLQADDNFAIPPSLYSAARESLKLARQTTTAQQWCKHGAGCKHLKMGRCSYMHSDAQKAAAAGVVTRAGDNSDWRAGGKGSGGKGGGGKGGGAKVGGERVGGERSGGREVGKGSGGGIGGGGAGSVKGERSNSGGNPKVEVASTWRVEPSRGAGRTRAPPKAEAAADKSKAKTAVGGFSALAGFGDGAGLAYDLP